MNTKREFESYFRREILPAVRARFEKDGVPDRAARREVWITQIDTLEKDGQIPERARDWLCPW